MTAQEDIAQFAIDAAAHRIPLGHANGLDEDGLSAIHYVAMSGDVDAALRLGEVGWTMTLETADGYSPFEIALDSGQFEFCDHMLAFGADINHRIQGISSLDYAAMHHKSDVATYLINNGAALNGHQGFRPPLCWAVQENSHEVFQVLLACGALPTMSAGTDLDDMTALHIAADDSKVTYLHEILSILTSRDVDVVRAVRKLAVAYEQADALAAIEAWLKTRRSR